MQERIAEYRRIAVFGGVYSNAPALEAMLADVRGRDVEAVFCLGDMGGFGPLRQPGKGNGNPTQ